MVLSPNVHEMNPSGMSAIRRPRENHPNQPPSKLVVETFNLKQALRKLAFSWPDPSSLLLPRQQFPPPLARQSERQRTTRLSGPGTELPAWPSPSTAQTAGSPVPCQYPAVWVQRQPLSPRPLLRPLVVRCPAANGVGRIHGARCHRLRSWLYPAHYSTGRAGVE